MKLIVLILAAGMAYSQTTRYPGALDSDSSLFVVSDNVQTTLNTAMAIADTTAVVASSTGFVPNMIATICDTTTNTGKCTAWEHMLVTAVAGNVLTVTRGFAGTTARAHSSGRLVSALIDSAHQKVLKDSVLAIETALGPNLSNISASGPLVTAGSYNFPAYSCNASSACVPAGPNGMNLIAGNNTLTMSPVPNGVNGTDSGHSLYVSGGTGAAEGCLITGGSGTSGQASGQIIINCANTHSGAWTITSASGGIQEAICSLPAPGGGVIAPASVTLRANVTACGKPAVTVTKQTGATISGAFTVLGTLPSGDETEIYDDGPVWTTFNTNWAQTAVNVNGYPAAGLFGAGTVSIPEAVRGAINIPANSSGNDHGAGLAGYAMSASTHKGALGLFTGAFPSANGVSSWGANFVTSNCAAPWTACGGTQSGLDSWTGYGLEIDLGIALRPGGAVPSHFARGVYVVNSGDANVSGYAFDADNPVQPVKMTAAYHSSDGFSSYFALIGTIAAGNNQPSQALVFRTRNSGGTLQTANIYGDSTGNLVLQPGATAVIALQDGTFNTAMVIAPNGSAPTVQISNALIMSTTAPITVPLIKSTTGQRYVCVTTTGQLVSSATACSGT